MKNQSQWVVKQLLENGRVSRNDALKHYITRLGALICDLNDGNWVIEGKYERTLGGYGKEKDYVYKLISCPHGKIVINS